MANKRQIHLVHRENLPTNHNDNNDHFIPSSSCRRVRSGQASSIAKSKSQEKTTTEKEHLYLHISLFCFQTRRLGNSFSLYGGAPVRVVAIAKAWGRGGLIRDAGHCLDGAAKEAAVGGPLPEGPPSPVVLHGPKGEAGCRFGRQAAAESLDLLGDEGGGGDVSVAEIADLLQGLPGGWEGVHVQGRQVDGGGGELFVGALIVRAQAVNPVMKVLQVDLLIVLGEGRTGGGKWSGGNKEGEKNRRRSEGCYRIRREKRCKVKRRGV